MTDSVLKTKSKELAVMLVVLCRELKNGAQKVRYILS